MPDILRSVPLTGLPTTVVAGLVALLALTVLTLAQPRHRRVRVLVVSAGVTLVLTVVVLVLVVTVLDVPRSEIPPESVVAGVLLVLTLLLGGAALFDTSGATGTTGSLRALVRRLWTVGPVAVSVVVSLLLVNAAFKLYPDVGSLDPPVAYTTLHADDLPAAAGADATVAVADWRPPTPERRLPQYGSLVSLPVPATASGFHARNAEVYLPPAWFTSPRPRLPVIVLMAGIPGSPSQWFTDGHAGDVAQKYQAAHHGLSPVVAVVDGTGSTWGNPVCTDSPTGGNARTYLTQDVPDWLVSRLDVDPDRADWTIGGLSYGGTCALQVVTDDPASYGAVLDLSGERTPVNAQNDHAGTVKDYFGGSEDAFRAANPEDLLTAHAGDGTYADTTAWFVAGKSDRTAVTDLGALADLAGKAGMDVTVKKVSGGHDFQTWRAGLRDAFPALAARAGLP